MRRREPRLHPSRLLTRLEFRLPALRGALTRVNARRFDAIAPRWDAIRGTHEHSTTMLLHALDELGVQRPARILDVGTGTGQAAIVLADRFATAEVHAVDASPRMIELACAKPEAARLRLAVADGGALPFADGTFDLVVSMLVQPFEHEQHRVLAPGGHAIYLYPMGPGTPIWFPSSLLVPRLEAAGFAAVRAGTLGPGEWTAGQRAR